MGRFNVTNYYRGKYIDNKTKCHYEERSDVVISSNNAIATPSARNDNKFACHPELTRKLVELVKRDFLFLLGDSESINANKTLSPTLSVGEGVKMRFFAPFKMTGVNIQIIKQVLWILVA